MREMMRAGAQSDQILIVDDILAKARPTAYSYAMLGLCLMLAMAEGYDAQAMAFAAPLVAEAWGLRAGTISMLLATSITGMIIGSFGLAPIGDRWGRRPAIILAVLITGLGTFSAVFAPDVPTLVLTRFIAGLGLGFAFPNVIALGMEFVPAKHHPISVVFISSGYPLGGAVGGWLASYLIPEFGYKAVFGLGGAWTLGLFFLMLGALAESPLMLARKAGKEKQLTTLLTRLGAQIPAGQPTIGTRERGAPKGQVRALFTPERRIPTLLLWLLNFANLFMVYYYLTWLPTIMVATGQGAVFAANGLALFSAAGIAGGFLLIYLRSKLSIFYVLGGAYLAALVISSVIPMVSHDATAMLIALGFAGAAMVGSQYCLNAVVNLFYPTAIRATASGFATGAGRGGALMAPVAGGVVMATIGIPENMFYAPIIPAVIAGLTLLALYRTPSFQAAER